MSETNGPQIEPRTLPLGGEGIAVIADAMPEFFPLGLEVVLCVPGKIEPVGRIVMPAGTMLAIVPPGMSGQIRRELRKKLAQQAKTPGKVNPPGTAP